MCCLTREVDIAFNGTREVYYNKKLLEQSIPIASKNDLFLYVHLTYR